MLGTGLQEFVFLKEMGLGLGTARKHGRVKNRVIDFSEQLSFEMFQRKRRSCLGNERKKQVLNLCTVCFIDWRPLMDGLPCSG